MPRAIGSLDAVGSSCVAIRLQPLAENDDGIIDVVSRSRLSGLHGGHSAMRSKRRLVGYQRGTFLRPLTMYAVIVESVSGWGADPSFLRDQSKGVPGECKGPGSAVWFKPSTWICKCWAVSLDLSLETSRGSGARTFSGGLERGQKAPSLPMAGAAAHSLIGRCTRAGHRLAAPDRQITADC